MELQLFRLFAMLGVAGFVAMAGCKVRQRQKVREDERRRRTLDNLRAALLR